MLYHDVTVRRCSSMPLGREFHADVLLTKRKSDVRRAHQIAEVALQLQTMGFSQLAQPGLGPAMTSCDRLLSTSPIPSPADSPPLSKALPTATSHTLKCLSNARPAVSDLDQEGHKKSATDAPNAHFAAAIHRSCTSTAAAAIPGLDLVQQPALLVLSSALMLLLRVVAATCPLAATPPPSPLRLLGGVESTIYKTNQR